MTKKHSRQKERLLKRFSLCLILASVLCSSMPVRAMGTSSLVFSHKSISDPSSLQHTLPILMVLMAGQVLPAKSIAEASLWSALKSLFCCLCSCCTDGCGRGSSSTDELRPLLNREQSQELLRKSFENIQNLLYEKNVRLILALDYDQTVTYGFQQDLLSFSAFQSFNQSRQGNSDLVLLMYNTSRYPGTLSLTPWNEITPKPDVLIMGGSQIQYRGSLRRAYSGLRNQQAERVWLNCWAHHLVYDLDPTFVQSLVGAEFQYLSYHARYDSGGLLDVMLRVARGTNRLGVWSHSYEHAQKNIIYGYDKIYNKGAALKRALNELVQRRVLTGHYWLITGGDFLSDSSMMNSAMKYPFDLDNPSQHLPMNITFVGSVIPHGAWLTEYRFMEGYAPDTVIERAREPSFSALIEAVWKLLDRMKSLLQFQSTLGSSSIL